MKKLKWVVLGVIVSVLYLNIGYLVAYSLDSGVSQTAFSEAVFKTVNFMNSLNRDKADNSNTTKNIIYGVTIIFWPFVVLVFWMVNLFVLLWTVFVWLVNGGIFRWLGLI
ncbi:MAG: hypothetical protein HYW79_00105 [Parcubacteria group bacterium]|nr:hypothetical protein [Parcubacteria group bacterium]